jgi:putative ATPase
VVTQTHLPEQIKDRAFYRPKESGYEKTISERLRYWEALRKQRDAGGADPNGETS